MTNFDSSISSSKVFDSSCPVPKAEEVKTFALSDLVHVRAPSSAIKIFTVRSAAFATVESSREAADIFDDFIDVAGYSDVVLNLGKLRKICGEFLSKLSDDVERLGDRGCRLYIIGAKGLVLEAVSDYVNTVTPTPKIGISKSRDKALVSRILVEESEAAAKRTERREKVLRSVLTNQSRARQGLEVAVAHTPINWRPRRVRGFRRSPKV